MGSPFSQNRSLSFFHFIFSWSSIFLMSQKAENKMFPHKIFTIEYNLIRVGFSALERILSVYCLLSYIHFLWPIQSEFKISSLSFCAKLVMLSVRHCALFYILNPKRSSFHLLFNCIVFCTQNENGEKAVFKS